MLPIATALLIAYPTWDTPANFVDAQCNGGLKNNPSQVLSVVVGAITGIATAFMLGTSMNAVRRLYSTL